MKDPRQGCIQDKISDTAGNVSDPEPISEDLGSMLISMQSALPSQLLPRQEIIHSSKRTGGLELRCRQAKGKRQQSGNAVNPPENASIV